MRCSSLPSALIGAPAVTDGPSGGDLVEVVVAEAGVAAKATGTTSDAPARRSTDAAPRNVAPVVTTSSTSSTRAMRHVGMGAERRASEPGRPVAPGLRTTGRVGPLEQPPTRHPELAGDVTGDQLGLVEASLPPPPAARRRPRDDVDAVAGGDEPVDEQPGEVPGDGSPVPVLEAEQDVTDPTGERRGDEDAVRGPGVGPADQSEPARAADGCARCVTAGTAGGEDHGAIMTKGCAGERMAPDQARRDLTVRERPPIRVFRRIRVPRAGATRSKHSDGPAVGASVAPTRRSPAPIATEASRHDRDPDTSIRVFRHIRVPRRGATPSKHSDADSCGRGASGFIVPA